MEVECNAGDSPGRLSRPEGSAHSRKTENRIALREPRATDGPAVSALIARCPPLDTNSAYCNLLQCTHFAGTCVIAESDDGVVGWVSAYRPPAAPEEIFVWQIAVDPHARGAGLGGRMLTSLLERAEAHGATQLTTTITQANDASWALFGSFANRLGVQIRWRPMFDRDAHFAGAHDTEVLVSIGPFTVPAPTAEETS